MTSVANTTDTDDQAHSAWESGASVPWERDLVTLFVRNQIRVFAALPILAALFALVSLTWTPWTNAACWLAAAIGCQLVQLTLCRRYLAEGEGHSRPSDWIGMLASSEFLNAACWSLPLFIFWDDAGNLQRLYMVASIMAVTAMRVIIAANFMPVVIAGTGFITFNIVVRCILEADPVYVALGAMVVTLELFFMQLAVRLQETARDMLIFRKQKERLIAELKREKEAAETARQAAEEANKAKSSFLAAMSHELRTPLNAIMGYSEIMSHEMFGRHQVEAYRGYSNDIHTSGHYLLKLINDILDLSRIEAGRHELKEEPVAIALSAEEAVKLVALRMQAKRQRLGLDIPADLPKLMADRRGLHQIWLNLLSNAVKFTPEGGTIEIRAWRGEDNTMAICVKDSGPGIPAGEISLALDAFSRGSYALRQAIDGAGLGLPIVKGLAEQHGGMLEVHSTPGQGTEAKVTFPAARVLDGPRGEVLAAPTVKSSSQRKLIAVTG